MYSFLTSRWSPFRRSFVTAMSAPVAMSKPVASPSSVFFFLALNPCSAKSLLTISGNGLSLIRNPADSVMSSTYRV